MYNNNNEDLFRKMFEFYAGSLRNESLVCTSYLE